MPRFYKWPEKMSESSNLYKCPEKERKSSNPYKRPEKMSELKFSINGLRK